MGNQFLDQYSLLHFASGVVAYHWGVPAPLWLVAHVGFEFVENTQGGMDFINRSLTWWPGGKPRADSLTNIMGDTASAMVGWFAAYKLDEAGKASGWYER